MSRHPLATPVQYVKGVGPALAAKLARVGILSVGDLLHVVPHRYIDRRQILPIAALAPGPDRTIEGTVAAAGISFMGKRRKRIFQMVVEDESAARVAVTWFHFHEKYLKEKFSVGVRVLVSGEATAFGKVFQFIHPEIEIVSPEGVSDIAGKILPIYPLSEGLSQRMLRKIVRNAWDTFNQHIEPVLPASFIETYHLADPWACLQELHFPAPDADVDMLSAGRTTAHRTLIFEEFFFLELGLAWRRSQAKAETGISFPVRDDVQRQFLASLPFAFTAAQTRVIAEIRADMAAPRPMNRLLQGDVGSGKTVVALAAALQAIAAGYQVAMMAPTELLAEQHYQTVAQFLRPLGIPHGFLTSSVKGVVRADLLTELQAGRLSLIVGTHALIQEGVAFQRLGLVIIDEQHRFGVLQRAAIRAKGERPDILVMTATPIPRTLAMTIYGDLDLSLIDELPAGRRPIVTRLYGESQREKLYAGMRHELALGRQCYVICPLIEESEKMDLKNATDTADEMARVFAPSSRVGLLHGRMKGEEKEAVMKSFRAGATPILVATSVVEVGVDVPNASVMVIEHAERFGLSQLHQLRGRVGRSTQQSYCILMADYQRSAEAKVRLQVMVETTDGFKIAEEDLKLRGPGEFLGTRQAGLPPFRIANLLRDAGLLITARAAAFQMMSEDPRLMLPVHTKVRATLFTRWSTRLNLAEVS